MRWNEFPETRRYRVTSDHWLAYYNGGLDRMLRKLGAICDTLTTSLLGTPRAAQGAAQANPALPEFNQKAMSAAHTAIVVSSSRPGCLLKVRENLASGARHIRSQRISRKKDQWP